MITRTVGMLAVTGIIASTLSYAQADTVTINSQNSEIIQAHLIGQPSTTINYHEYALAQAKARWGTDKPYTDAQKQAIKDIETAYSALDKNYQQQLSKITKTTVQPLLTENNTDYINTLTTFYQTDLGKQISGQKTVFETNKNTVLTNLPTLLSQQISTNDVITVMTPQNLSATQP